MRAPQALPTTWSQWFSATKLAPVQLVSATLSGDPQLTMARHELVESLAELKREGASGGDCFVFGQCSALHERALNKALADLDRSHVKRFWCAEGGGSRRGYRAIPAEQLDEANLSALRQQHRIRRVELVIVAEDFGWSLGRVIHAVSPLLGTHTMLLVAGAQAAVSETMWLEELRRGQRRFDVHTLPAHASSWARFRLRRRHHV